MKIKRVGWWIVINDSGGTVKTFSVAITCVVKLNCIPLCIWHVNVRRYCLLTVCCCCWLVVDWLSCYGCCCCSRLLQLCSFLCAKVGTNALWTPVPRSRVDSRRDLVQKVSFQPFPRKRPLQGLDHISCTILQFCAPSVGFLMTDDSQQLEAFSIVSRTSVICAIT